MQEDHVWISAKIAAALVGKPEASEAELQEYFCWGRYSAPVFCGEKDSKWDERLIGWVGCEKETSPISCYLLFER